MKLVASFLVVLLSCGDAAAGQQASTPTVSPAPVVASATPPPPNTLLDGTAVKLRLAENLSSEKDKTGQQVPFEVTEEVVVQGVIVIPKGAQAVATITNAEPKKRMGRGGKLDVNVDSVRLVDGEKAQLRAVRDTKAGGHVGAMTGAMVATSLVFFPAAPLFLFMHGKSVDIPRGTEITAFVQGDMHLDMSKFGPNATVASTGSAANSTPTGMASLTVESSVSGADIEVDGVFAGNTPSTISVSPGAHTIVVKKRGFSEWTRTMNVSGTGARLSADLEAKP